MLCYIKTNNTAAIYAAAALLVDTASLSKVVPSSELVLLSVCWAGRAVNWPLLATGSKYISTLHRAEQSKVLSHGHRILLPASAALLSVAQELEMSDDFREKKSPTLMLGRASLNPPPEFAQSGVSGLRGCVIFKVSFKLYVPKSLSEKKSPTLYYSLIDPVDPADNICHM